nr:MAG TPA: hypothetical protein [Caudoviricetes sp.]
MIKYENQCCGCAVPAYPCLGESCPNIKVPRYYCDICGNECSDLYYVEGDDYCLECMKKEFAKQI